MYEVVVLLTKQIDALAERKIPGYKKGLLHEIISQTKKIKGRLLYYYPVDKSTEKEDGWIGWHNDSGFLTALTSAMFVDDSTGQTIPNPDPQGGLWIVSRDSDSVHVKIPADHLAVQCGECLQVITGGLLIATPHCVRASHAENIKVGRSTFPVFVDSDIDFKLAPPAGVSRDQVLEFTAKSKVPPLADRWTGNDMTFSEFLKVSFEQFYSWNQKN
jgi:isopenicillin N synthase-like dioxygenase